MSAARAERLIAEEPISDTSAARIGAGGPSSSDVGELLFSQAMDAWISAEAHAENEFLRRTERETEAMALYPPIPDPIRHGNYPDMMLGDREALQALDQQDRVRKAAAAPGLSRTALYDHWIAQTRAIDIGLGVKEAEAASERAFNDAEVIVRAILRMTPANVQELAQKFQVLRKIHDDGHGGIDDAGALDLFARDLARLAAPGPGLG